MPRSLKFLKKTKWSCKFKQLNLFHRQVKHLSECQEERITILKMALIERGILSASHYETANQTPSLNHSQHSDMGSHSTIQTPPSEPPRQIEGEGGDRGVYL
jgi:uncharacterized protein (DUF2132 family)